MRRTRQKSNTNDVSTMVTLTSTSWAPVSWNSFSA